MHITQKKLLFHQKSLQSLIFIHKFAFQIPYISPMRHNFILLFCCLLCSNLSFAQEIWQAGYIINKQGDSIHGFIKDQTSVNNARFCRFKTDEKSKTQTLFPDELNCFKYDDGRYYVSKQVEIQDSVQECFLEFLIKGKLSIYHLQEDNSNDKYFVEKDGKIYELKNTLANYRSNGRDKGHFTKEKKEYIGLLYYLLADANMQTEISDTELNGKSLTQIASEYQDRVCNEEKCIIYERRWKPVKKNLSIQTGYMFNYIDFEQLSSYGGRSYSIGARCEFENIIQWHENLSIVCEVNLHILPNATLTTSYSGSAYYNNKTYSLSKSGSGSTLKKLNVDLDAWLLQVPFLIHWNFSRGGETEPYIGLGVNNTFRLKNLKSIYYQPSPVVVNGDLYYYASYDLDIPFYKPTFILRTGIKQRLKNSHFLYADINALIPILLSRTYGAWSLNVGYEF